MGGIFLTSAAECPTANTFPASLNLFATLQCIPRQWANNLEAKVGVTGSASTTSLDYQVNHVFTSYGSEIIATSSLQGVLLGGGVDGQILYGQLGGSATSSVLFTLSTSTNVLSITVSSTLKDFIFTSASGTALSTTGYLNTPLIVVSIASTSLIKFANASGTNQNLTGYLQVAGKIVDFNGNAYTTSTSNGSSGGSSASTTYTYYAGSNINANDAVFAGTGQWSHFTSASSSQMEQSGSTGNLGFGVITAGAGIYQKVAVIFGSPSSSAVTFSGMEGMFCTTGAPADAITMQIMTVDGSNNPTNTVVASTTIVGSLQGCFNTQRRGGVTVKVSDLSQNTKYAIVLSRNGALDDSNYFQTDGSSTAITYQTIKGFNGASWVSAGKVALNVNATGTYQTPFVYQAAATTASSSFPFIGFAPSAAGINTTTSIQLFGTLGGFNNLTIGQQYYLTNTSGSIGVASGTVMRKVGMAVDTSTLIILNQY